jgi:hypothetical protein
MNYQRFSVFRMVFIIMMMSLCFGLLGLIRDVSLANGTEDETGIQPAETITPTETTPVSVAVPEPEPEKYDLSPQFKVGEKFIIEERYRCEGDAVIQLEEEIQSLPFLKGLYQKYEAEVMDNGTKRNFVVSRKQSFSPSKEIKEESTSLEGKVVFLIAKDNGQMEIVKELTKQAEQIQGEDIADLRSVGQFGVLLPQGAVLLKQEWAIDGASFAKIVFKEYYDPENCEIKGTCVLEDVVMVNESKIARSKIKLHIIQKNVGSTPGFVSALTGTINCDLTHQWITHIDLSGPCVLQCISKTSNDEVVNLTIKGNISFATDLISLNK